jgi:hypothetical protein
MPACPIMPPAPFGMLLAYACGSAVLPSFFSLSPFFCLASLSSGEYGDPPRFFPAGSDGSAFGGAAFSSDLPGKPLFFHSTAHNHLNRIS